MKILLLSGSVADKSHTRALLHFVEELLRTKGVDTIFWDLKEKALPPVIPEYHSHPEDSPDATVREFVNLVSSVDGIVLGSPLYHGSYAGVLKNALDCLAEDGFRDRPVAIVTNGAGVRSGTGAVEHLRIVVRTLCGYATQRHVHTNKSDYKETPTGYTLVSADIKERCRAMVAELLILTKLLPGSHAVQD